MTDYIELSWLQEQIKGRIGDIRQWIRAEISSCNVRNGHYFINLIEKAKDGSLVAKADACIWKSNSAIVRDFAAATGKTLENGMSIVALVKVNYHSAYGLSLEIQELDANYSIGQRELEKQRTIKDLTDSGLIDRQQKLGLPFFPGRVAVISASGAAGYGDFIKHLGNNAFGFKFDCTLFSATMQGENCPVSVCEAIEQVLVAGNFDLIVIMRGGGSNAELFAFDDYSMCEAIATCPVPVFTAIGHDRDYHVADMVARYYFKTPTALADALIDWVAEVENEMLDIAGRIQFALSSRIDKLDYEIDLCKARIDTADPRKILDMGYVLASGKDGKILKSASSQKVGDDFSLRFSDGMWKCGIKEIKSVK